MNSTVNDSDLRTFYSSLNRNEVIKEQKSNQPRFGLQGNKIMVRHTDTNKLIGGSSLALQRRNLFNGLMID